MFSALNFLRFYAAKKHDIKDLEFSPAYLFFYDKLERANYFYQNIIDTASHPLSDRKVNFLFNTPQQDGGDWMLLVNLVKKYGLVPNSTMTESKPALKTNELNFMFNRKLRNDAMKLRDLVNTHASSEELNAHLRKMNKENYNILSIAFGTPPKSFVFEYYDKNKVFHSTGEITPIEFFKKFVDIDLDNYIELMNLKSPDYPFDQSYGIDLSNNMVDGQAIRYLNVPMHDIRHLAIEQLKDGLPVWFACDVLQEWFNPAGLLSVDSYDWNRSFGFKLDNNKAQRVKYQESMPTHAMLICGVDLEDDRPTKWKVQNSWGPKVGHKGYFIMSNEWMNQYTYNIVVNKKYLSDKQLEGFEKDPIELPFWTDMYSK